MTAQLLAADFSRRVTSLSMAARMRSRRSSPSASTASIRALAPRGRVRLTFSCHSFARPMRRGVSCTWLSVKALSFRVRDSLTYHVRGICSIIYTIGHKMNFPAIRGPYPADAAEAAHSFISGQYHRGGDNTARCAASFNTPYWQDAVWRHLSDTARTEAVARGRAYIAQFVRGASA